MALQKARCITSLLRCCAGSSSVCLCSRYSASASSEQGTDGPVQGNKGTATTGQHRAGSQVHTLCSKPEKLVNKNKTKSGAQYCLLAALVQMMTSLISLQAKLLQSLKNLLSSVLIPVQGTLLKHFTPCYVWCASYQAATQYHTARCLSHHLNERRQLKQRTSNSSRQIGKPTDSQVPGQATHSIGKGKLYTCTDLQCSSS